MHISTIGKSYNAVRLSQADMSRVPTAAYARFGNKAFQTYDKDLRGVGATTVATGDHVYITTSAQELEPLPDEAEAFMVGDSNGTDHIFSSSDDGGISPYKCDTLRRPG